MSHQTVPINEQRAGAYHRPAHPRQGVLIPLILITLALLALLAAAAMVLYPPLEVQGGILPAASVVYALPPFGSL